jgi:hypothetical protein
MTNGTEPLPTDPRRVKAFASFFKNYMSVSSVIVAALPIPLTAFNALPIFADYKSSLSTYTSLFCFLTLGFIFYSRHRLARWMFPEFASSRELKPTISMYIGAAVVRILPLILIVLSGILMYLYHYYLDWAIFELHSPSAPTPATILAASYFNIPLGNLIRPLYVGMFVCAEAAFILMATKEYIQDLLQLSDIEVIKGERKISA